jgi:hypothetical protein
MVRSLLKKASYKHKNSKLKYYSISFARQLVPATFFQRRLRKTLAGIHAYSSDYLKDRVNYYNKLSETRELSPAARSLATFKLRKKHKTYFFDSHEYTRYFDSELRLNYVFGDITAVPDEPAIVKSRPIRGNNENSVLLKLNKVRHFIFTNDRKDLTAKKNMLVGRNVVGAPQRARFYEKFFGHPLCDLGKTNRSGGNERWLKERLTIDEQLNYKFILCIEGNDVASNLKWVMSSNSLAVMPEPKYETWFMEGKLIADQHYVSIKDDFSDLEDKLSYYMNNTDKALRILDNAHQHVNQFKNKEREDLISLLVLEKYFYRTGQTEACSL